jgi:segregation and condensation protein B
MSSPGEQYASALGSQPAAAEPSSTPPPIIRIIEALLFAGGQPLNAELAGRVIRGLTAGDFHSNIEELNRQYRRQNRPFTVQSTPSGFVMALRPKYDPIRERLIGAPREARLSRAAIDVLALVAFRQPIARPEIDSQRGSDSAAIVRQLVRLGLIVAEPAKEGQTEAAYSTTPRFLELFGLNSLDDLPRTMDLQQV